MFEKLNNISVPVLVTDSSYTIVYKNVVAGKCFMSVRLGGSLDCRLITSEITEKLTELVNNGEIVAVTLRLPDYDCCCLVMGKEIEGKQYRFFTIIPYIMEFFALSENSGVYSQLMEHFEECIGLHIKYLEDALDGISEPLSNFVKGSLRKTSRKILEMEYSLKTRMGITDGMPVTEIIYNRKINIVPDIQKLAESFNNAYGSEFLTLDIAQRGLFCNGSRAAFGRVFTYISFLCLKYNQYNVCVKLKKGEGTASIEFHSGTNMTKFKELIDVELGYIRAYAEKYGFEVNIAPKSAGSVVSLNVACFEVSDGVAIKSATVEIGNIEELYFALFAEAKVLFGCIDNFISPMK